MLANLEAVGVSRRFGWRWALREVNFSLERGSRVALLGANGSGKTTLLRILSGLLRPNKGEVLISGNPVSTRDRARIGLLGHDPLMYPSLTLRENLEFFARLFCLPEEVVAGRCERFAEVLGISERLNEPINTLSQGLRQRAALARAMLHEPEFFLLDEPFAGLDQVAAAGLESILRDFSGEGRLEDGAPRSFLLTEHDIPRALSLSDNVVVLSKGEVVLRAPSCETSVEMVSAALGEGG